jgi:hypothetical protein
VPRRFGYGPCPHRGDHFLRRHGFPAGGSYTHFEPKDMACLRFPHRGSHPTGSKGEVEKTVKTSSAIDLFSSYVGDGWRIGEHVAH